MKEESAEEEALPIPRTDEALFELVDPFVTCLADAIAATACLDGVLTLREYQALARVSEKLDSLSPFPSLVSSLILQSLQKPKPYRAALKALKKHSPARTEQERLDLLDALAPLLEAQMARRNEILTKWANALDLPKPEAPPASAVEETPPSWIAATLATFRSRGETLMEKAQRFARTFEDDRLAGLVADLEASKEPPPDDALVVELRAAVERVTQQATATLKSPEALDDQIDITERFLNTANALSEQVTLRLQSVRNRLALQSEMFREDINEFLPRALDSVEIGMRDLIAGREDWTDPTIWEQFKTRGAVAEVLQSFQPLRRRYERLFEQWQAELQSFSREVGTLRRGVLLNVDPRAFGDLIPATHPGVRAKNKLDQAAETTLGLAVAGTVGAVALGGAATIGALVATPALWVVAVPVGVAAAWKLFAHPEARKRKTTQGKRRSAEQGLREALTTQEFQHDEMAKDILDAFLRAAYDQYAPLVIDARLAALRARLEARVVRRVLTDTQASITGCDS